MKDYLPVSKLPFISKRMERVVASGIEEHLDQTDQNDSYQSAYHIGHTTETALLKVHIDIAEALDEGSITALIRLELFAAFDVAIILLWNRIKCFNLGKVVPRRQNSP